jgi:signal transduction histidine kinase
MRQALRIAAIYLVLSAAWIYFSDQAVDALAPDPATASRLQTLKGWFFVLGSAVLVWALAWREVRLVTQSEARYRSLERSTPQVAPLELRSVVERVMNERGDEIRARGVQLTVDIPDATVRADATALDMILRNLLENALKFTRDVPEPHVAIAGHRTESGHRLEVRDNGIGFDMRFHDKIFLLFERLHRPDECPGTGIGLAMASKAAERMGARLWARSHPGEGATFSLELPA